MASKIVHVSKGDEVVNHVQILSDHFKFVGSPIMIGKHSFFVKGTISMTHVWYNFAL